MSSRSRDNSLNINPWFYMNDYSHLIWVCCLSAISAATVFLGPLLNTLRPRQNGRHFPDDIFKRIFFNENVWISFKISLKFVPKGPINSIPALVQITAWRRPGDKPLSEAMLVSLLTHKCVTRPQWVKKTLSYWYRNSHYHQISNIRCTNTKTSMFLVSSCSCLCQSYWRQVLTREWRCSWSSADRQGSNYIWVINNFIAR